MQAFITRDGLRIAADLLGQVDGPLVVLLHGGGQTRHSWGRALSALAANGFRAVALDLRGHGDSGWAPDGRYDLDSLAGDLSDVLSELGTPAALVGASLGGLTSLLVASEGGPHVTALVLVDVVPRVEMEGAREIRDFMTANPNGFGSVDEASDAVAAFLPHRPRRSESRGLMKNLRLRSDGRYYWHWDPAMLSSDRGPDPQAARLRLEAAARQVRVPTLLIRGGLSRIVSMEGVKALQALIPQAELVNVADADHMVAGDANDAFNEPLLAFLERTARGD